MAFRQPLPARRCRPRHQVCAVPRGRAAEAAGGGARGLAARGGQTGDFQGIKLMPLEHTSARDTTQATSSPPHLLSSCPADLQTSPRMPAVQIDVINSRQQGFLALFAGDTGEIRPEVGTPAAFHGCIAFSVCHSAANLFLSGRHGRDPARGAGLCICSRMKCHSCRVAAAFMPSV